MSHYKDYLKRLLKEFLTEELNPKIPAASPDLRWSAFWMNVNTGEVHDVGLDSKNHVEHVVRNYKKFGFNTKEEVAAVSEFHPNRILDGREDTDHKLTYHLMQQGFIMGTRNFSMEDNSPDDGSQNGAHMYFSTDSHQNLNKALHVLKPHIKDTTTLNVFIGHPDTWRSEKNVPRETLSFTGLESVERHLSGVSSRTTLDPNVVTGIGNVTSDMRDQAIKALKVENPNSSPIEIRRALEKQTKNWGDSTEHIMSFKEFLLEYSLGPNHPDFGKPEDPPPDNNEIRATIRNRNGVQLASSDHPSGLTVKSAMVDGTYMFGIYYGKPLLHEVIMDDGRVKHVHKINPETGDPFILESETDKVESLVARHLSAHVHDSDGNPTRRSVHEHHISPEG